MMTPPIGPPPGTDPFRYIRVEKPKSLREVPAYLEKLLGGFFYRLFYIFGIVWQTSPLILFMMLAVALFQGLSPVISSFISQHLLNALQTTFGGGLSYEEFFDANSEYGSVFLLLIFTFAYKILTQVVNQIDNAVTRVSGEKIVRCVKVKIMEKAKELDLSSFDQPAFYEKLENANREAGTRPIQILSATFAMVSTVISLVSFIVILATAPGMWWTAIVMVLVSVPSAIINFTYRRKNFNYMRRKSKERRQMSYFSDLMVNKDMAKEIRMFDLSDTFIGRYKSVFDIYYSGIKKLILTESFWHIVIAVISAVTNCLFFVMIAFRVFTGEMMLGDYSLYTGALASIAGNVGAFIVRSATIYEGTLFIDNLISFLDEKKNIVPRAEKPEKVHHGEGHTFVFDHVSFSYPGTERPILHDLNLTIRPGETLVIVGLNGAGKTTLLKLLTRLYDPTEGRILLDGKDLRDYDVQDLYRMFGIIFQDFGKYAVSVKENIHYGNIHKQAGDEEIKRAAVESDADTYIEKLPDGYATPLMRYFEENGMELSIGQWQKLAIARAFYSDSDVLILDEPTASLDPMAEQEIFNQFDRLRTDKTTIFVSHRLSSATVASKIVVLEYGHILEEGTHKELMAKRGRYYELFSTQAKRYISEGESVREDTDDLQDERGDNRRPPMQGGYMPHGQCPSPDGRPPFGDRKPNGVPLPRRGEVRIPEDPTKQPVEK